jgi:RNA methyltransferase, TrmH family
MKQISSRENPRYKELLRLARSTRARREQGIILLEGVHLIRAYIDRFGSESVELFVKQGAREHPEISAIVTGNISSMLLDDSLFERAAPVQTPVGILALAARPVLEPATDGFHVLLDAVQDPGNVGAILRSAAAAGAVAAHLSPDCADPWSPKALRGGMGAQFVIRVEQPADLIAAASTLGTPLIACVASAPTSLFDADLRGAAGFIIGGEGAGISPALVTRAHQLLRIPMSDGIESLNAAAAASVVFYERLRQLHHAVGPTQHARPHAD